MVRDHTCGPAPEPVPLSPDNDWYILELLNETYVFLREDA